MQYSTLEEARARFFDYQRGENHSPKQLAHYRQTFQDFDRFLEETGRPQHVGALTSEVLQAFVVWLKETPRRKYRGTTQRSAVGIAGHMKDLRAFIRWCSDAERNFIDWKVTVPAPKVPETLFPVLTDAEMIKLWSSRRLTGKEEFQTRNRALIALLLDTGIRLGELAALRPEDIHGSGSIRYIKVWGKGNKERLVPFTPQVGALLEDWLAIRSVIETDNPTLFLLAQRGIQILVRRIWQETGVHVFSHKLRHTAATNLVRGGADPFTVKEILGHTQISTTLRYVSQAPEDISAKHAAASPFARLMASLPQEEAPKKRRMLQRGTYSA